MVTDELQKDASPSAAAPSARSAKVTTVEPRRPELGYALKEIWGNRRFSAYFGRRFVRKRYSGTWLGLAWLPLRPALDIGTKLFVFGGLVGISVGHVPYSLFVIVATAAWQLFAEGLSWSTRSLYVSRGTLRIVHVPRLVVIVGAIVPTIVDFLIVLAMAGLIALYYLIADGTTYLTVTWWSPVYVLGGLGLLLAQGIGMGIVGAVLGSRTRDVRFILGYVVGFLYFLTPILYSFQQVPERYRFVTELNPMTGAIEVFKAGVFGTPMPPTLALTVSIGAVVAIWGPGFWLFHRQEVREW